MRVVDAHLHLCDRPTVITDGDLTHDAKAFSEPHNHWSAAAAVDQLLLEMESCNVIHAVVLHLLWQPWTVEEVARALACKPALTGFINIDPRSPGALESVRMGHDLGFRGIKLHPRIHAYRPDDDACIAVVRRAAEFGFPVLVDCFPDGNWLMAGLNVLQYATLARKAPDTAVIVAHAAGHHCLDLMMLAKRVKNLWFDISYSMLYYQSPIVEAIFYAMESIRFERVLFGTDYPDRPLKASIEGSMALMDRFGVCGIAREKLLWRNASELLSLRLSD